MSSNVGNRNGGSIAAMLAKNKQAPTFGNYVSQHQNLAEKAYVSKAAKLAYNPSIPLPPPPPDGSAPLISAVEKKNEYVIGDTKEEIINNIITKKASVANVRKALSKYADMIMEEEIF
jgi:hypothetical protein